MRWEIESLKKIEAINPEIVTRALSDLWKTNPELFKMVVINSYLDGNISLAKAAESLCITRIELEDELRKRGIPVRTLSKEDIIAEGIAAAKW